MAKNLTAKQTVFCREYHANPIPSQAYETAFGRGNYSQKSLGIQAAKLLSNPRISQEIARLRTQAAGRTDITPDRVLREYGRLAFFDPLKLFDSEGHLLAIKDMDADTRAAIASIEVDETSEMGDKQAPDKISKCRTVKLKLWDKRAALGDLTKILGMNKEPAQSGVTGTVVQLVILPSGQALPPANALPVSGVRILPSGE